MSLSKNSGFTLIEILISVSILSLITGLSLASFSRITTNQSLTTAENDLVSMLQLVKSRAQSQVKPSGCTDTDTLGYWYVYLQNTTSYYDAAACGAKYVGDKLITYPTGVTMSSPVQPIWFHVGDGTVPNGRTLVTLTSSGQTKTIVVYPDGRIVADDMSATPTPLPLPGGR